MQIKTIKVSQEDLKVAKNLYDSFYEVYGNINTIWSLDDLNEMIIIGQDFMEIFAKSFYEN